MKKMYYYKQNGENLEKWLISFDKEELTRLREGVVVHCSYITHEEKALTDAEVRSFVKGCFRNATPIGEPFEEINQFHNKCIYQRYSYDYYKPKFLVAIIDALLNGEASAIDELDNPRPTEEKFDFGKELAAKSKAIDEIPNLETERKVAALQELHEFNKIAKLNENQVSALDYYPLVQELITRELVDTVKVDDVLKITGFFGKRVDIFSLTEEDRDEEDRTEDSMKLKLIPKV